MKTEAEEFLMQRLGETELPKHRLILDAKDIAEIMQEYSDQQTANLKAVNEKQRGIDKLIRKIFTTPYSSFKAYKNDEAKLIQLESELAELEKEPTAMEMIKEVFEPIQLGEMK